MNVYKDSLTYVLFLMSFIPVFLLMFWGESRIDDEIIAVFYTFYKYILGPLFLLIVIILNVDFKKAKVKNRLVLIFIGGLLFIISFFSKNISILNIFLFLLAIKNVKISNVMRMKLFLGGLLSLIIIGNFILDISYGDYSLYILDSKGDIRYTFGYEHPNNFPMRIFSLLCIYCILRKKFNILDVIFCFGILYLIYEYTISRTTFIVGSLLLMSIYFYHKCNYLNLYRISFLYNHTFLIFLLLSIFLVYFYSGEYSLIYEINTLLSGRVSMGDIVLNSMGITLWGNDIEKFLIENQIVLDNLYLYIILGTGIVFTSLSVMVSYKLFSLLGKHKLYKEIIVLVFVLIYSLSEKTFLDIYFNLTLFLFSFLLYENKISEYKNENYLIHRAEYE